MRPAEVGTKCFHFTPIYLRKQQFYALPTILTFGLCPVNREEVILTSAVKSKSQTLFWSRQHSVWASRRRTSCARRSGPPCAFGPVVRFDSVFDFIDFRHGQEEGQAAGAIAAARLAQLFAAAEVTRRAARRRPGGGGRAPRRPRGARVVPGAGRAVHHRRRRRRAQHPSRPPRTASRAQPRPAAPSRAQPSRTAPPEREPAFVALGSSTPRT